MRIRSLKIDNLRVIQNIALEPGRGINFIVGENGAGKTSVLEGIYLAGRGRTFRHAEAGPMIRQGSDEVTVFVELEQDRGEERSVLGVQRTKKGLRCRLDGRDVYKRSVLAETLPVQWIGSQPQLLLSLGPDVRRRFIDMGLFHVEHTYLEVFNEYQRHLRQRNAAIKDGAPGTVRIWNAPLAKAANEMHQHRERFVADLARVAQAINIEWGVPIGSGFTMRYRAGWNKDRPLLDQLESRLDTDLKLGYTTCGPHRAELELVTESGSAEKTLSRGQQKLLVLAMNLALLDLVVAQGGSVPVVLIDDLAAELDSVNRQRMVAELEKRGNQAFLTKIDESAIVTESAAKTFHVEHGRLVP